MSETESKRAVLQVGERLGRYEVEKRCAVEKEDYDLAKEKKQQMEQYRAKVYEQLELHSLADAELVGAQGCVQRGQTEASRECSGGVHECVFIERKGFVVLRQQLVGHSAPASLWQVGFHGNVLEQADPQERREGESGRGDPSESLHLPGSRFPHS